MDEFSNSPQPALETSQSQVASLRPIPVRGYVRSEEMAANLQLLAKANLWTEVAGLSECRHLCTEAVAWFRPQVQISKLSAMVLENLRAEARMRVFVGFEIEMGHLLVTNPHVALLRAELLRELELALDDACRNVVVVRSSDGARIKGSRGPTPDEPGHRTAAQLAAEFEGQGTPWEEHLGAFCDALDGRNVQISEAWKNQHVDDCKNRSPYSCRRSHLKCWSDAFVEKQRSHVIKAIKFKIRRGQQLLARQQTARELTTFSQ